MPYKYVAACANKILSSKDRMMYLSFHNCDPDQQVQSIYVYIYIYS